MCVSAPFGDYDYNAVREIKPQQAIQWLATNGAIISWRELSTMLYQSYKTETYGKSL